MLPSPRCRWLALALVWTWGTAVAAGAATNRFEKEIAAFEARDRAHPPEPGRVVFFGSSSFRLWTNLAASFPNQRVVNRGFGGSVTSELVDYFERVVPAHAPRVLLVYGGDNDIASGKSPREVRTDFDRLVQLCRKRLPKTRVVFVSIKPSPSRRRLLDAQRCANCLVRRYAFWRAKVEFVDLATCLLDQNGEPDSRWFAADRLHLNSEGYRRWTGVLAPRLARWCSSTSPLTERAP